MTTQSSRVCGMSTIMAKQHVVDKPTTPAELSHCHVRQSQQRSRRERWGRPAIRRVGLPLMLTSRALLGVATCFWLAAVWLAPTRSGVGAALSGHHLADLIGSGAIGGAVPPIMGPIWYAMPIGAAVVLATLGLTGTVARLVRFSVALLATGSALGFTTLLTRFDWARFGPGSWCAVTGAVFALVATAIEVQRSYDSRRIGNVL